MFFNKSGKRTGGAGGINNVLKKGEGWWGGVDMAGKVRYDNINLI